MNNEFEARLKKTVNQELGVEAENPRWSSLNHARILIAAEREFGFRVSAAEAVRVKSYADLLALVLSKTGAAGE